MIGKLNERIQKQKTESYNMHYEKYFTVCATFNGKSMNIQKLQKMYK